MSSNPFRKLIEPRLPRAAVGLTEESAAVVSLVRRDSVFAVERAGEVDLPQNLVQPSFDRSNIADRSELAGALSELAASAGMAKRQRWSVALPEAATRTVIVTLDGETGSKAELEETLGWKIERAFAVPLGELRVTRQRLRSFAPGTTRVRYLVSGIRVEVLAEYESVFDVLGWRAGLILPRSVGEASWLMKGDAKGDVTGDSLLISFSGEGFTAIVVRDGEPLIVRSILCDAAACTDELYRLLLFYRDRLAPVAGEGETQEASTLGRLLIANSKLHPQETGRVVGETLDIAPRLISAEDVRVTLPSTDFNFATLAAPTALAALAWN